MPQEILKFWFEDIEPAKWWVKDPHFDQLITQRFAEAHTRAAFFGLPFLAVQERSVPRGISATQRETSYMYQSLVLAAWITFLAHLTYVIQNSIEGQKLRE